MNVLEKCSLYRYVSGKERISDKREYVTKRWGYVLFCVIVVPQILAACSGSTVSLHQTYKYSLFPDPPYASSHFDSSCQTSVDKLHGGATIPLIWIAAPVMISGVPAISHKQTPASIHIRTILIGPYKTCGTFQNAVSQDGTLIKGHIALALPVITTDDWHAMPFKQLLSLPSISGYYVFYEQRWQSRSEVSKLPSSDQHMAWIQVVS